MSPTMVPLVTEDMARLSDSDLVKAALTKWGGNEEVFARQVANVDPSTLRRWKSGAIRLTRRRRQWFHLYLMPPTMKEGRP